jgi:hypothetical protein
MLIPTKHENLDLNILVIGGDIIKHLKGKKMDIENLYQKISSKKNVNVDSFYNTITFLWLADILEVKDYYLELTK